MQYEIITDITYGPKLVLLEDWSDDLVSVFVREGIECLAVCRQNGTKRDSLDFLAQLPWLKSFMLLDVQTKDISGVHHLTELRHLDMADWSKMPIDFTKFSKLKDCYLEFSKGRSSVGQCTSLENLRIQHYCFKDLSVLTPLSGLTELWFSQGSLGDISKIGALSKLKVLTIAYMRNLEDISPASALKNLEELDISNSKRIQNLSGLGSMPSLRVLKLIDCGEIDSLEPLLECTNLEELYFGGTTIRDGNLKVLQDMPNLKKAPFFNKKHYNMTEEEFVAAKKAG